MSIRQILLCILLIALSEAMTITLFYGCRLVFHADPFSLYANLVISLGGLLFGWLGCLGAYPAARLAGIAPGRLLLALMLLLTWAAILFYHALPYVLLITSGGTAPSGGFLAYLDARTSHTLLQVTHGSDPVDVGRYGYLFLLVDLAWAAAGPFVWFGVLRRIPYCRNCQVYFRKRAARRLTFADAGEVNRVFGQLPDRASQRARALMQMVVPKVRERGGAVRFELTRRECPSCGVQSMTESLAVHNGKGFRPQRRETYTWSGSAGAEQTLSAPPQIAPRAQFGRKGT